MNPTSAAPPRRTNGLPDPGAGHPPRRTNGLPDPGPGSAPLALQGALPASDGETEAFRELSSLAHGRTGRLPVELVVDHVLRATRGGDFPVQRAAMEALLRRVAFARRDELRVAARPGGGASLGSYETRALRSTARPYATLLLGVDPLRGSCGCPDFVRSSLGLCKHLVAVLDELAAKPRRWARALAEQREVEAAGPRLAWDPVRPLRGPGDPLERVRFVSDGATLGAIASSVRSWFAAGDGPVGIGELHADDPGRRLELVRALLPLARPDARSRGRLPSDPALVPLLVAEEGRLSRLVDGVLAPRELRAALAGLKLKLYPYQQEGVRRFLSVGRLLLADDMGLGKTAQAIASCHALHRAGKVRRGLLVVPASLKPQWLREWQLFTDTPVSVVDGTPAEREALYREFEDGFLIVNYEQVVRDLPALLALAPDLVVLDEAQRIKNWATKTALHVKRLGPRYRLVLTGTPLENRLDELASIHEWVDDLALEPRWRLTPWHATLVDGRQEVAGARNLDTLRVRLAGTMLRRVRQEVLAQLPPRADTRVPVELTPAQEGAHSELDQPIRQLMARAQKRPLSPPEFIRLMSLLTQQRIICNGLAQLDFEEQWPELAGRRPTDALLGSLAMPKLGELRELVANLAVAQERKVVVFSQWTRMLKLGSWAVSDLLEEAGLRALFFTGDEGQKRRTQNLVDFHDDPRARVLFASDAGGVGLNLQRAANALVNLEVPWNPAVLEQRIGRIYRMGQKSPIDVYHLICERGIEPRIAALVGDKRALFTGLFDGTSDEVRFERSGSFMSRVERLVEPAVPGPARRGEQADEEGDADRADELAEELEAERSEEPRTTGAVLGPASRPLPTPAPAAPLLAAEPTRAPAAPSAAEVGRLFSQLSVRPTAGGGLSIEAPPEAAATLVALFSGMAQLLSQPAAPKP